MMIYNRSMTATVYLVRDRRVLLHMHKKYKTWFPVGGHMEAHEFPHEAALREVREETGLGATLLSTEVAPPMDTARVERLPAPFCLLYEGIGHEEEFLDFIYVARVEEGEPSPAAGESRDFRWFTREELLTEEVKPHVRATALAVLDYVAQADGKDVPT